MEFELNIIREKLIDSIYSDKEANSYFESKLSDPYMLLQLIAICAPFDGYSNDPRMGAAYYISKYEPLLLAQVAPLIASLLSAPHDDYKLIQISLGI